MISTFNELMTSVKKYITDENDLELIKKAYFFADKLHGDAKQFRKSGEPYIVHPLNVAHMFSETCRPRALVIAVALLHDVVEDIDGMTVEILAREFGWEIANKVACLTKIKNNALTTEEEIATNQRKILDTLNTDVEVILVKLFDCLHNMMTLEYQPRDKQIKIAKRIFLYANLAYQLGINGVRKKLEDLCFKYILPHNYEKISKDFENYLQEVSPSINEMMNILDYELTKKGIEYQILRRDNNLYSLFQNYSLGKSIYEMHDLIGIKIITDNDIDNCYRTLGLVHKIFKPQQQIKDYISNPKTNMYESIHTTIFGIDGHLVQARIRTREMEEIANLGIAYDYCFPNGHEVMQKKILENMKTLQTIITLNNMTPNNVEFIKTVESEIGNHLIYVLNPEGKFYSLPSGSNSIDFAFRSMAFEKALKLVAVSINDHLANIDQPLKTNDVVHILTQDDLYSKEELIERANTTYTKRLIRAQIS